MKNEIILELCHVWRIVTKNGTNEAAVKAVELCADNLEGLTRLCSDEKHNFVRVGWQKRRRDYASLVTVCLWEQCSNDEGGELNKRDPLFIYRRIYAEQEPTDQVLPDRRSLILDRLFTAKEDLEVLHWVEELRKFDNRLV